MKVNWLLEKDVFEEGVDLLAAEIKRQGMKAEVVSYVPFEGDDKYLSLFEGNECVVFYGSLQMARQVQRQAAWVPGVYCDLPKFECTHYYPFFGDWLLNSNYVMLPYGELNRRKDFLLEAVGDNDCVFIRPSSGFKIFTGRVVSRESWDKDVELFGFYDVEPDRVVVVAEPSNLVAEWRTVVVGDEVVSASQYKNDIGVKLTEDVPPKVFSFAQEVLKNVSYRPDPVWCMDVCETKQGELKVLEVGCFSSAGLYVAPKEAIVREVSKIAWSEWEDLLGES